MFKSIRKNKKILRSVGIVLVGGLVIILWWQGLFSIVFYILGLYGAVYIISYLFKTTSIIAFLITVGSFAIYAITAISGLYLFYLTLQVMFGGHFIKGLLLMIALGTFGFLLYFIPMAIGFVLGYPLIFMADDLEKRFNKNIEIKLDDNILPE